MTFEPWSFALNEQESPACYTNLPEAYAQSCARFERHIQKTSTVAMKKKIDAITSQYHAIYGEYYAAKDDYIKRLILRDLLIFAEDNGISRISAIGSLIAFAVMFAFKEDDKVQGALLKAMRLHGSNCSNAERIRSFAEEIAIGKFKIKSNKAFAFHSQNDFPHVCRFISKMNPDHIMQLLDPHYDTATTADIYLHGLNSEYISDDALCRLEVYVKDLERQKSAAQDVFEMSRTRLRYCAYDHFLEPVQPYLDKLDGFTYGIVYGKLEKMQFKLLEIHSHESYLGVESYGQHLLHKTRLDITIADALRYKYFWYVVLSYYIQAHDLDQGDFLDVGQVVLEALRHPKRLMRYKCSARTIKFRSFLSKRITPFLIGKHREVETYINEELLNNSTKESFVHLVADYISSFYHDPENAKVIAHDKSLLKRVKDCWDDAILPHIDILARRLMQDILVKSQPTLSVDDLETRYLNELDKSVSEVTTELIDPASKIAYTYAAIERDLSAVEPININRRWVYVIDIDRFEETQVPISINDVDDAEEQLTAFLRKQKAKTVIRVGSIVGALDYFNTLYESGIRYRDSVQIQGKLWAKLKRGSQRILVRRDDQGRTLFHVYPRKEWTPEMFN